MNNTFKRVSLFLFVFILFLGQSIAWTEISDFSDIAVWGDSTINSSWQNITFNGSFTTPVVFAEPVSYLVNEQGHPRIRNVGSTWFEIKFEEWKYLDGVHGNEQVSWLVLEKGEYLLANQQIQVGLANATISFTVVNFTEVFNTTNRTPVIITQSQTVNGPDPIVTRNNVINQRRFQTKIQEEEAEGLHVVESVGYLAGVVGTYNSVTMLEFTFHDNVRNMWKTLGFQDYSAVGTPYFLGNMMTTNYQDPASLRYNALDTNSVEVFIEEEQSFDKETIHGNEQVGYLTWK